MPFVYKCDCCGQTTEKQAVLCPECVKKTTIGSAILFATLYMDQNNGSFNSYVAMGDFIDWLQAKERKEV
jgi:hypothetical protein